MKNYCFDDLTLNILLEKLNKIKPYTKNNRKTSYELKNILSFFSFLSF